MLLRNKVTRFPDAIPVGPSKQRRPGVGDVAQEADDRRAEGAVVHEAGPDMGLANPPPNPSQREAEVDRVSGGIAALPMIRTIGSRLDAGFDEYQTGLLARTEVETRRIKEVSQ